MVYTKPKETDMKVKIIIIEKSFFKFNVLKTSLASQLGVQASSFRLDNEKWVYGHITNNEPNLLIYNPNYNVWGLIKGLEALGLNADNCEVRVLLTEQLSLNQDVNLDCYIKKYMESEKNHAFACCA